MQLAGVFDAWWRYGILVLLLVSAVVIDAETSIPNPFPPGELTVTTLSNGVRLVVHEDQSLPLVSMVVVVHSGSAAESAKHGTAHYLEHLVFQGTEHYPGPLAPQAALEAVGGISSAVTGRDMTRYQATVAAGQVGLLVKVLADLVLAPTLSDGAFAQQQAVILAEIQHEDDDPVASVINHAFFLSYPGHPYRVTSSGLLDDVRRLTAADVRAYYRRWYVPNNISVVLVGDVTPTQASDLIKQAFGKAPAATLPVATVPDIEPTGETACGEFTGNLPDTYQVLAFPAPADGDDTAVAATDFISRLLVDGNDALLPACWAQQGITVKQFGIEHTDSHYSGRLLLWAQCPPEQADKLRDVTIAYLHQLAQEGVPPGTLSLAEHRMLGQFLLENETYAEQASTIGFYEGLGNVQFVSQYASALQALTPEQIRQAIPTRLLAWVTGGAHAE